MNITEKILAKSAGVKNVQPGDIIDSCVDILMIHDLTGPLAVKSFEKIGIKKVWNNQKIIVVLDHQIPAESIKAAELHKTMRNFAKKQKLKIYDVGKGGICHQVLPEKGHVLPGKIILGADSHTCTYGAFGAFATGIGSTEAASVMTTGKIWLKVPESIKINVKGKFKKFVTPKDLILFIVGKLGAGGAIYKNIEFSGSTISTMGMSGRMTVCNMAVEMGAKNGIIEPDKTTKRFLEGRIKQPKKAFELFRSDSDSIYEQTVDIDVTDLEPQIACSPSVDNIKVVSEVDNIQIDQAFIGSCTNGRIEDLRLAAKILKGKKVKDNVRTLVIPASQEVYLQALKEGLVETFTDSGAFVCGATCGPCLGGHIGILAEDEVCVSTSNRNFIGRMGSKEAKVYLASPATVAASAIAGRIIDPQKVEV
ncbi:3-isopropylmalate dehydratase large subunit [Candidatus Bathyarchaeota archaeon]|nr:3-isopropylmalate dehydratase large subunit [Candidatus Bathyarchaeota archaeon]